MEHNLIKKNYSQKEAGKWYFIKFYKQAVSNGIDKNCEFCKDVFDIYDKHKINGHIKRPNGNPVINRKHFSEKKKNSCPKCGEFNTIIPVVAGYPTTGAEIKSKRGEIYLWGCLISDETPNWYCKNCKHFRK